MRIGVIATEFPPMKGGIPELARGLATALAATEEVQVYTPAGHRVDGDSLVIHDGLTGQPWRDAPALSAVEYRHDAWLALNGGLAPLAGWLHRPFYCYLHGNDFLNPWLACGPRWMEAIRRPYAAEIRHAVRRGAIRRGVVAARHLVANSHQTAALVRRRLGVTADRVSVVHPGVGDAFFQQREAGGDETLRLLTVARLSRHTLRKNIDGVLRAIALLGEAFPVRYTVVGEGDDRPRLEALVDELGLGGQVEFAGSLSREHLLAAYRRSDLFVLASKATKRDVEGFGIVYLEASAGGVPVICSREGGATDAVVDGRNGVLIDRSTPEAIAAGIARFGRERGGFPEDEVRACAEELRWPKVAARLLGVLRRHL